MRTVDLVTPFENNGNGWNDTYPRPQFKRKSFISLCGEWDILLKDGMTAKIEVPFPPESRISGIGKSIGESYIYSRVFDVTKEMVSGRLILNFGAADQIAKVFINKTEAGCHVGGYLPFSFDITDLVKIGQNVIEVEITDKLDINIPYGKQSKKRGGMWYTPISGLWQTVWLEAVPENYISSIKLISTLDSITIQTSGGFETKTVKFKSGEEYSWSGDSVTVKIDNPRLWSPEDPYLYEFILTDGNDSIESYFALRTIEIKKAGDKSYICLNGKPYFFHGVLDQGYFSDGIYLPTSPKGYEWDVVTMKKLGFNMLRKHIKIEPEIFYYYCDKYGMIVFQDMVNSGKYRYVSDTVLPTIGFKKRREKRAEDIRASQFEKDAAKTVNVLYNHPCICYYTIFNEGWGQYESDRILRNLKLLDKTRVWDSTSGWFEGKESDVTSEHVYFKKVKLKRSTRPVVLSEFGGYSCKIKDHSFNLDKEYGYKKCKDTKSFAKDLERLYREEIIPAIEQGLNAAVLTQLSDIEDETNGLVTYDRQVVKVSEKEMQMLSEDMHNAFKKGNMK